MASKLAPTADSISFRQSAVNCGSWLACDRAISPHTRLKAPTPLDRLGEQARAHSRQHSFRQNAVNCGSWLACDRAISPHTRLKAPTPLDRLGEQACAHSRQHSFRQNAVNCGSWLACDRAISPHTRLKAPTPLDRLGEQASPTVDCIPSGKTQSTVGAGLPAIGLSAFRQGSRLQPNWTALASKPASPSRQHFLQAKRGQLWELACLR